MLNRRTGTPTGSAPREDELFNYALISDEYKAKTENKIPLLTSSSTNEEIVSTVNKIIKLLNTAGIVEI